MQTFYLTYDIGSLVLLRSSLIDCDGIARWIVRPEVLFLAGQIVLDHSICRSKDILR